MSHQPSPSPTGGKQVSTTTNTIKGSNGNKDPKRSDAAPINKSNDKRVMAPPPKPRKRPPGPPPEPKDKRPPLPPGGPRDPYDCMFAFQPCHMKVTDCEVFKGPGIAKSWSRISTSTIFVSIMRSARRVYEYPLIYLLPQPFFHVHFQQPPIVHYPLSPLFFILASSMSLLSPLPRHLPPFQSLFPIHPR